MFGSDSHRFSENSPASNTYYEISIYGLPGGYQIIYFYVYECLRVKDFSKMIQISVIRITAKCSGENSVRIKKSRVQMGWCIYCDPEQIVSTVLCNRHYHFGIERNGSGLNSGRIFIAIRKPCCMRSAPYEIL